MQLKTVKWLVIVLIISGSIAIILWQFKSRHIHYPRITSLQGTWQRQFLNDFTVESISPDKWTTVEIPSINSSAEEHFAAYRKLFKSPIRDLDEKAFIHFKGVAFSCQVYINNHLAGKHGPTLEPFSLELTPYIKEAVNELVLIIRDWTSCMANTNIQIPVSGTISTQDEYLVVDEYAMRSPFDKAYRNKAISPMGYYQMFGILDDVWLEIRNDINVTDVSIEPLVSEDKLSIKGEVWNSGKTSWQGELKLSVKGVRESSKKLHVTIAAGKKYVFEVLLDGYTLTQWEPDNPVIYQMVITAIENVGQVLYRTEIPFGYRQVSVKNHELFLNNKKIHLFVASISSNKLDYRELKDRILRLKEMNINAVRFHRNVFPEWYYELTDRYGILVIAESGINGAYVIQNNYDNDIFYRNAETHWHGLVRKFRHHPSVVVYSIENECVEYSHGTKAVERFAEIGKRVKEWDPSRPILFNGGDDPKGVADIINLHYPHELPFWNLYPIDAWWLSKAIEDCKLPIVDCEKNKKNGVLIDSFWYRKPDYRWVWDRKKPLDLGEIGYFTGGEPHMDAVLLGDIAYGGKRELVRDEARAEAWKGCVEAARALDVAMINPWNPPKGKKTNDVLREVFKPIKLVVYPGVSERYYSGSEIDWHAVILNDTREIKELSVQLTLTDKQNKEVLFQKRKGPYTVPPGGRNEIKLNFNLPDVNEKLECVLTCSLFDKENIYGNVCDKLIRPVSVYPAAQDLPWRRLSPIELFDPQKKVVSLFDELEIPFRMIESLSEDIVTNSNTLVIGSDSLVNLEKSELQRLRLRVTQGEHSTLFMEQGAFPSGFPAGLTLNDRHSTTLGFIAAPAHSILKSIGEGDVQLWGRDMLISRKDLNLPVGGGYKPLLVSGGTGGLIYSPLIEKHGLKGSTVFCQLLLIDKFWEEPSAARILFNSLDYLEKRSPVSSNYLEISSDLSNNLSDWGIRINNPDRTNTDSTIRLIEVEDIIKERKTASQWLDWVREGNVLWVSGIEPESMSKVKELVKGLKCLALEKNQLPIKIDRTVSLADGILNQFLYWTERHPILTHKLADLKSPSSWALEVYNEGLSYPWEMLCSPALIVAANVGKGLLLVDTIDWGKVTRMKELRIKEKRSNDGLLPVRVFENGKNQERAVRLLSGLLTNLKVNLSVSESITIEAENMSEKTPGQPLIRNRNHHYWGIFKNNYIAQDFDISGNCKDEEGKYVIEVKARCRQRLSVPPRMRIRLDGVNIGECSVDNPSWRIYEFNTAMSDGKHRLEVSLINNPDDAYNHRYLHLDWIKIEASRPSPEDDPVGTVSRSAPGGRRPSE